ncbi:unnamed protein product [Psylliodes chrysocephalus]|uniref:Condensin complex subunit 2 n=1 Tax=Psylliodes chrysocephalus TaxID=3402493 RepID=A0A9P0DBD8_9CUCU|nr:unnamed protein product [Psylliodes chrysocephala]
MGARKRSFLSSRTFFKSRNSNFLRYKKYIFNFPQKITVKNAWKLQIIDILKPLCQKHGQNVLQVASTSIDISAKVYGIRVDDVHSEGLKLASNMARVSEDAVPAGNDDAESGDEQDGGRPSEKAKKKKKTKVNTGVKTTVAKNPKSNLGKLSNLEPTDFTTRVNADTGTIDNLFSNILKESSSSFILLDASKKFLETSDSIVKNDERMPLNNVLLPLKHCSVNAPLHDFIVNQWDPEQEIDLLNADKSVLSQIQPVVFDDNGFPIPELDGSVQDCFENNDADVEMDNLADDDHVIEIRHAEHLASEFRGSVTHVVDFRPTENTMHSSEYSFNSIITNPDGKYIDQIWAGPSHWKLKCLRRSTPRFSGQIVQEKQKRQKKKPEMIDFTEEPGVIDFIKRSASKKRSTIDLDKITLPLMDQSCARIMTNIKELILKHGVCPVEKTDKPITDTEELEVNPYNYENENDSLYCSQSQPHDNLEADDNVEEDEGFINQEVGNLAENLVDNPEMVPNTYIHYAQKSKQIDMRKLKKAIWMRLTGCKTANSEVQQNVQVIPQNFSNLYKSLPELLGQKEKQEMSCPLAFVALLHLCNEQNLQLTQLPGYKDCLIKGPVVS